MGKARVTEANLEASTAGVGATSSEFDDLYLDEDSEAESLVAPDDAPEARPIISEQAEC